MIKSEFNPKLAQIKKHFDKIEEIFNRLPNGMKDIIYEQHAEGYSLNHCLRWGQQATEELIDTSTVLIREYNKNYE